MKSAKLVTEQPTDSTAQLVPVGMKLYVIEAPVPNVGLPHLPGKVGPSTKADADNGTARAPKSAKVAKCLFTCRSVWDWPPSA
jgi:hypothetical protein